MMNVVSQVQDLREDAAELNERLRSVRSREIKVEKGEKKESEELEQVSTILRQVESMNWEAQAESVKSGELEAIEDLEMAVENLERVCSELGKISDEIAKDFSEEKNLIERGRDMFFGVKEGEYTVSGPSAEEFADSLNKITEEISLTEKEVSAAASESEKAVREGERIVEIIEESDSGSLPEILNDSGLEEQASQVQEILERAESCISEAEKSKRKFQELTDEVESMEGVEDSSRRNFLKAASTVSATAIMGFSGCIGSGKIGKSSVSSGTSVDRENPWGSEQVVVSVESGPNMIEGFTDMLRDAAAFWERNDQRYLGYPVDLVLRENSGDAQIRIRASESIESCGDVENAGFVGCTDFGDSSAEIRIEAGHSQELTSRTLKHELGHALGLSHEDKPQGIMSGDPSDRIENFEEKDQIISFFRKGMQLHNSGIEIYRTGVEEYENENFGNAEPEFREAWKKFEKSVEELERCLELSREIRQSDASRVIERGLENATHLRDANKFMVKHLQAYQNRNKSEMERFFSKYQQSYREADAVDAPSGEALQKSLEL